MSSKLRRRSDLALEIALVLAVKALALLLIWNVWFAHPSERQLDSQRIADAIYTSQPVAHEGTQPYAQP
jgi:hypothetical protein